MTAARQALQAAELMTLEHYARERDAFRAKVLALKRRSRLTRLRALLLESPRRRRSRP